MAPVETDNWAQEVATLRAQLAAQDEAIGNMNERLAAVDAARSSERWGSFDKGRRERHPCLRNMQSTVVGSSPVNRLGPPGDI